MSRMPPTSDSIRFQYGIPSSNELRGVNLAISDVGGFNLRSEYVSNRRNRRFPNQTIRSNQASLTTRLRLITPRPRRSHTRSSATGAFQRRARVLDVYVHPDSQGFIDYEDEKNYLYELIDDNDDQDRFPDWQRRAVNLSALFPNQNQFPDREVFPGLDENQDFISDFNQNQNNQPDYSEPFFRYHVDPPEFLFGTDMNNNTVIDRFENDTEADYPYKRDSKGYNLYVGVD